MKSESCKSNGLDAVTDKLTHTAYTHTHRKK